MESFLKKHLKDNDCFLCGKRLKKSSRSDEHINANPIILIGDVSIATRHGKSFGETEATLQELERVGKAATALVKMNALLIESEGNEFAAGQLDLAKHAGREFSESFAALKESANAAVAIIGAEKNGGEIAANPFNDRERLAVWSENENALKILRLANRP